MVAEAVEEYNSSSELTLCSFGEEDNPFSAPSYKTPATAAVAEEVTLMCETPSSSRCPQLQA